MALDEDCVTDTLALEAGPMGLGERRSGGEEEGAEEAIKRRIVRSPEWKAEIDWRSLFRYVLICVLEQNDNSNK